MHIIFCNDPLQRNRVDVDFEREREAAKDAGLATSLLDFEALLSGNLSRALRDIDAVGLTVYRGWMLRVELYAALYQALAARGALLVNDPAAYRSTHWLPESLPHIAEHTPATTFTRDLSPLALHAALAPFGDKAVIVKDFVKSRKHEWDEACFIPCASDTNSAERVISRLRELQGDDFTEGIVVREFIPLASTGRHPASGMPLGRESRVFIFDGKPIMRFDYWEGRDEPEPLPAPFVAAATRVPSRFFTMDVAQRADTSEWIIMELGDGQVAGLPEQASPTAFYRALGEELRAATVRS